MKAGTEVLDGLAYEIAASGFGMVGVLPGDQPLTYTVGLGLDHPDRPVLPDVAIVGLHPVQARRILSSIVAQLFAGKVDPLNRACYDTDLDLDYSVPFRLHGPVDPTPLLLAAHFRPEGRKPWAVQLLWPDEDGRFPTDGSPVRADVALGVTFVQPLMGPPPMGGPE